MSRVLGVLVPVLLRLEVMLGWRGEEVNSWPLPFLRAGTYTIVEVSEASEYSLLGVVAGGWWV